MHHHQPNKNRPVLVVPVCASTQHLEFYQDTTSLLWPTEPCPIISILFTQLYLVNVCLGCSVVSLLTVSYTHSLHTESSRPDSTSSAPNCLKPLYIPQQMWSLLSWSIIPTLPDYKPLQYYISTLTQIDLAPLQAYAKPLTLSAMSARLHFTETISQLSAWYASTQICSVHFKFGITY